MRGWVGLICLFLVLPAAAACSSLKSPAGLPAHQSLIYQARDRVLPALVHIQPVLEVYHAGEKGKMAVTGSGVIFSPEGYILTNTHVVGGAQRLTCTLSNQHEVEARLIGVDPFSDLAVIKIDIPSAGSGVRHAALGDSSELQVGEVVMALGSPLGLARSLSLGVVSSLNRYFPESTLPTGAVTGTYNTWIQTDAAINPGNSGGPLVDLRGRVIGINARAIPMVGENLGFAIPINLAKEIAAQLIARGQIARSWIGVSWQPLQGLADYLGVAEDRGALVASVIPGSPADEAGLQAGDVVTQVAAQPVAARYEEDLPALQKVIADLPVGGTFPITFVRSGQMQAASLITRDRPGSGTGEMECREWGFTVQEVSAEAAQALRLPDRKGALVSGVKPNSFADEADLRRFDVVMTLEGRDVAGLPEFKTLYQEMVSSRRGAVLARVRRGRLVTFHVLKPVYPAAAEAVPVAGDDASPQEPR
ncbi:MAG: trypsin-like peptidase domain-containing protein [Candidatus Polarisedimenticolia bacterium]